MDRCELYINVSVLYNSTLYFTACNSSALYGLDINCKKVEFIVDLPCRTNGAMKFSKIVAYNGKLWMIPWAENIFIVYDLANSQIITIDVPYTFQECEYDAKFRDVAKDDRYIWLLPARTGLIVRIDMRNQTIKNFDELPPETSYGDKGTFNFKCFSLVDGYLYLFRDKCNRNLKFNIATEEFEFWNVETNAGYGVYMNNKIIIPQEEAESLPFWFHRVIDDYIYALPYGAAYIRRIHSKTEEIKDIRLPMAGYKSLLPNKNFAVYEIQKVDNEIWALGYRGNKIMRVDGEGSVIGDLSLQVAETEFLQTQIGFTTESRYNQWDNFLVAVGNKEGTFRLEGHV